VSGLDAGADDYVVKPFDSAELIARIRSLLRRSKANSFPLLVWGDLLLNPSNCEVYYNYQPLTLTNKEYELLELMLRDSQHLLSADEILDRLWSSDEFPSEATVRSHIRHLRHKLVAAGAPSDFIATVHGRGYYLKAPDKTSNFSNNIDILGKTKNTTPNLIHGDLIHGDHLQTAPKVMIVDNDVDCLLSFPDLLQPWGFKVTTLAEPQEFWTVLRSVLPDILVLDMHIPQINGLELCQALRGDRQWQHLPVVLLSVMTDENTQNMAFAAGADDYLCKPVSGAELANRIINRLQRIKSWRN